MVRPSISTYTSALSFWAIHWIMEIDSPVSSSYKRCWSFLSFSTCSRSMASRALEVRYSLAMPTAAFM